MRRTTLINRIRDMFPHTIGSLDVLDFSIEDMPYVLNKDF